MTTTGIKYIYHLGHYINEAHKSIFEIIYRSVNLAKLLEKPCYNFSQLMREMPTKYGFIVIPIIFNLLPKVIPAIIFIIEILLYNRLMYFYKSLFLILIAITYNMLLWIISNWADKSTYFASAHIHITYINEHDFSITFRDEIPNITIPLILFPESMIKPY